MLNDDFFEEEVNEELAKERSESQRQADDFSSNNGTANDGPTYNGPTYSGPVYGGQQYGSSVPPRSQVQSDGNATASMILGIASLVLFCSCINVVTSILAIIFGSMYLRGMVTDSGRRRAIAGIVTGIASLVMFFGSCFLVFSNSNLANFADDDTFRFYYQMGPSDDFNDDLNDLFNDYQRDFDPFENSGGESL